MAGASTSGFVYVTEACESERINAQMPANRAGHAVVSTGSRALTCGGYTQKSGTGTIFVGNGDDIECWWFTPVPYPRFDVLQLQSKNPTPAARWGHILVQDKEKGHVILFGGMTKDGVVLNDCWILNLSIPVTTSTEYRWVSCSPTAATALKATPRYGAGGVFFNGFFVYAGFTWNGRSIVATDDMWLLRDYDDAAKVEWVSVDSVSERPLARGFHAMFLLGYTIFIHGGQGPGGTGVEAVRSDTWSYDIYTRVWSQYGSSDASPAASMLSVR